MGARTYIDKMSVFQWVLIVLFLLQICFCFVMRETLCYLCQTIINLMLLKLLTNGIVSSKIYDKRDDLNLK